ncbi:NAD(P)H-binding protein [Psychrobacter sp. FDAARGOS_221]|uniref:NAD(P)H-binding protein n=1 Tax=Psychrobacter sp. FDAARGOS_221 TaxID=1975705 RepID=UPI000BB58F01|nr:NAD(P)H-binding protein [Psychrobacter sp. FDAARGOS_221]PNK59991.1 oxidoreductase [Psychrobacter sp. FDAARGOS_221]
MKRKAIVIGATGLVGRHLVRQLSLMYDSLIIIARKPPEHISASMQFYQLGDFSNLEEVMSGIAIGADTDAFTCLGTTMKQAGSEEDFRRIDYDYNLSFANSCREKGVQRFFLLSALGADSDSRFFYNRVKAELETDVRALGFKQLLIFRPSLLLGKHKGRLLENGAQAAYKLFSPLVPKTMKYRPIEAQRVAAAMVLCAQDLHERHKFIKQDRYAEQPNQVTVIDNKQLLTMTQL